MNLHRSLLRQQKYASNRTSSVDVELDSKQPPGIGIMQTVAQPCNGSANGKSPSSQYLATCVPM